ncbi:MAG: hypothetical protein HRT36_01120 [Alphaproteobacteria bacterium]|nr:hypothetical protein [Alphaproteobacteria bacterium]
MAEVLPFRILCPDGVVAEGDAGLVVIPGVDGDLGVLLRHSAMIVQIRRGTVAVFSDRQKVSARYYIDGGTAHITPDTLMILSDMACDLENLDEAIISQGLAHQERAEAQLHALKNPVYA